MTDWRGTCELVRERLRQCLSEHAKRELGGRRQGLYPGVCLVGLPVAKLKSAFSDGSCGWPALIFRSDEEREAFISKREPQPNGRPRGEAVRAAATMALYFYDAWRTENKTRGIGDYGHRGEMKFLAAQAIVEDFFAWRFSKGVRPVFLWELGFPANMDAFIGAVHGLMDKPKSRRQPKRGTCLEYLATGEGLHFPPKPPLN